MEHAKKTATLGRRGILAIGVAMAAGIAAKGTAQPVAAGDPLVENSFIASGVGDTGISTPGNFLFGVNGSGSRIGVSGEGVDFGMTADGTGIGILAATSAQPGSGKAGVFGKCISSGNFGVVGDGKGAAGGGTGVTGVQGQNAQFGVVGTVNNAPNTIGVWGNNTSVGAGPIGVFGSATNGIGVFGTTSAAGQFGVVGQTLVDNAFGIAGIANTNGSAALAGSTTNPNSFAGSFQGHVQVFGGAFDVFPMGNKHGLAQHPDGSVRTFYSVESPECWVEDFGEGMLANGAAEVALEKDFAALIHTDKYHVFLTPHGDHHLHVAQRHDGGFSVAADVALAGLKGKKASDLVGTFSWRVVAKPKTEANVERLAKGRLAPKIDMTKLPKQPPAPTPIAPQTPPTRTPSAGGAPNPLPAPPT